MSSFKAATTAFCIALVGTVLAPVASADAWNRKTVITFSGPVEIPGVHRPGGNILPAGTYVFKILNSQSNRHVVQIFSEDQKTVHATILAIPNYRLKVTDKTVITFRERPAGQPEALRAWFYPGRNWGEEFVYPKAQALELAKATNTPVLFTPEETAAEPAATADVTAAPIRAVTPAGEEVELAQVVTPPPAAEARPDVVDAQVQASAPAAADALPATSSMLSLIGLFGLASLGGAFVVRSAARRMR